MKLYKADISNQIGNKIITVPTDSQFLIGLSTFDPDATIKLFDGATEIQAEEDKVNAYTCFRFSTGGTPFRKLYTGVVTGSNYTKTIDILVICEKLSIAYRDMEGEELTEIDFSEVTPINAPWVLPNDLAPYATTASLSAYEEKSNKVTAIDSSSTDTQYPTAKCVYDGLELRELLSNKVATIDSASTDSQYPTAKCVYDLIGDVESLINAI